MMKLKFIILLLFNISISSLLFPQEEDKIILNDIAEDIAKYKNKTITLKLRLKNLDTIFDKIIFYDKRNIDIVFDIAELKKGKSFQRQALNIHRGMEYHVVFTIKELTQKKIIIGELKSFTPVILSKISN